MINGFNDRIVLVLSYDGKEKIYAVTNRASKDQNAMLLSTQGAGEHGR